MARAWDTPGRVTGRAPHRTLRRLIHRDALTAVARRPVTFPRATIAQAVPGDLRADTVTTAWIPYAALAWDVTLLACPAVLARAVSVASDAIRTSTVAGAHKGVVKAPHRAREDAKRSVLAGAT